MSLLDFRTFPCPQPVVQCRKFLQENTVHAVEILVDNEPAVENVTRYLTQQGFFVQKEEQGADFLLKATRDALAHNAQSTISDMNEGSAVKRNVKAEEKIVVFITTETLGRGDDVLGSKLMNSFLATLPEMGASLWRVVLLNGGVKLAVDESIFLEALQNLEKSGVDILVCGACLGHYALLEQKRVGETSNMLDIVTSLQLADKVIRP